MNFTNITYDEYNEDFLLNEEIIVSSIVVVLGFLLNLWQLCAIVTSADLRLRMRNKLILSTCVLHLTECCLKIPVFIFILYDYFTLSCQAMFSYYNICLIQDLVTNWVLVEMIALYLCQIMEWKISDCLSILGRRIGTISVLLSPWVVSLITIPAIYSSYNYGESDCFIPHSFEIFKWFDSIVPLLLSIVLFVVAILKKRNRYGNDISTSNMQEELISRGAKLDETSAYVVALVVSILCDIGIILNDLGIVQLYSITYLFVTMLLENSRVIFMVLPWLLFKDIRTRMKTWGPWYRSPPDADLALTYRKSQEEP